MNDSLLTMSMAFLAAAAPATAQWQSVTTPNAPQPLQRGSMAGSPTGAIALYGGFQGAGLLDDTYIYANGDWTLLNITGPSARYDMPLVHDSLRNRWLFFGGQNGNPFAGTFNETWSFDGAAWSQLSPANQPPGRFNHGMAYDAARDVMVVFGGAAVLFGALLGDTWEFDGTTWTQMSPAVSPPARHQLSMCYNAALGKVVMFGGGAGFAGSFNDTWHWDGTNWTLATPGGTPPAGGASGPMIYNPSRGTCMLHTHPAGGGGLMTFEYDGVDWTTIGSGGPPQTGFALAYDFANDVAIAYGGNNTTPDTWSFGATNRTFGAGCAGSSGTPALSANTAPRFGTTYTLTMTNVATAAAIVFSNTEITPTPLDPIGMPGCTAYVSPDAIVTATASAGTATWSMTVPSTTSLAGFELFAQGLSIDPNHNAAWLVASNAQVGVLGY